MDSHIKMQGRVRTLCAALATCHIPFCFLSPVHGCAGLCWFLSRVHSCASVSVSALQYVPR